MNLSTLIERFRDFRNKKVSDPAFRQWATRFPLTRPIARRQTKALFDLTAGFVYSQVLAACVRVGLFEKLSLGAATVDDIASMIGLPTSGARRLLKAAAALDLVEARAGERYALGKLGAALIRNEGVTAMIRHHDILYGDLRDPIALLAGDSKADLRKYWAYGDARSGASAPCATDGYTRLMASSQAFVTAEILDAYQFADHKRLLDVGGGDGTFLAAVARAASDLKLGLFDLPPVVALARERIHAAGLDGRVEFFGGSFLTDELPVGADIITLNRVLHDHDDAPALLILKAIRAALEPGGTLLIAEPLAGTAGARASGDAYFGFYLLAMGQGTPRTIAEICRLLHGAGFGTVREIRSNSPLIVRIITAKAV